MGDVATHRKQVQSVLPTTAVFPFLWPEIMWCDAAPDNLLGVLATLPSAWVN
jgi:hypothetical protein